MDREFLLDGAFPFRYAQQPAYLTHQPKCLAQPTSPVLKASPRLYACCIQPALASRSSLFDYFRPLNITLPVRHSPRLRPNSAIPTQSPTRSESPQSNCNCDCNPPIRGFILIQAVHTLISRLINSTLQRLLIEPNSFDSQSFRRSEKKNQSRF